MILGIGSSPCARSHFSRWIHESTPFLPVPVNPLCPIPWSRYHTLTDFCLHRVWVYRIFLDCTFMQLCTGCGPPFWKMVQTYAFYRDGGSRPQVNLDVCRKNYGSFIESCQLSFRWSEETLEQNKRKLLSKLKSPIADEPGNSRKLQNPILMLKSVGRAYFPMRYQISTLDCTLIKNKSNLADPDVQSLSEAECKPKVPADAARAPHGLYPTQKQIWIRERSI